MREISGTAFFYPILNRYSRWLNTVPFKNWLEFEIDYIQQYCSEIIKNLIWFDILENFKFLFQLIFVIIEAIGVFYKKTALAVYIIHCTRIFPEVETSAIFSHLETKLWARITNNYFFYGWYYIFWTNSFWAKVNGCINVQINAMFKSRRAMCGAKVSKKRLSRLA